MKYEKIRNNIQTGDIILFSGRNPLSDIIKVGTLSRWSHVAMALRLDEFDIVLCFESTTLGKDKDILDGKFKKGVQLISLSDKIEGYVGEVAIRHLDVGMTFQMREALRCFRKEVKNRPYEQSKIQLIKSAIDIPIDFLFKNKEDLSSIFCSELVAEAYQRMGILGENKSSNEYVPGDFSSGIKLKKGSLGELIYVSI